MGTVVNRLLNLYLTPRTIKSPHILELSGIGDGKLLASLGVPVQVDLPAVGTNLQDHLLLTGSRFRASHLLRTVH